MANTIAITKDNHGSLILLISIITVLIVIFIWHMQAKKNQQQITDTVPQIAPSINGYNPQPYNGTSTTNVDQSYIVADSAYLQPQGAPDFYANSSLGPQFEN